MIFITLVEIIDRVDKASDTETVDLGSIPGRVKPKAKKIGIRSFRAKRLAIKGIVWSLNRVLDKWAGGSFTREPKDPFSVTSPRQLGE